MLVASQDSRNTGLDSAEAARRLREHGPNSLPEPQPDPLWKRFLRQFQSPLIYVLLAALAFEVVLWLSETAAQVPLEAVAITAILLGNACIGLYQEGRADKAVARLARLAAPWTWAMRDGEMVRLPSREVVPGDVVRLEAGDRVPADGELIDAASVSVDESTLTGESFPVDKQPGDPVASGTLAVRGRGLVRVTRTGPDSELGQLAGMLDSVKSEKTPLERKLDRFGARVARWVLALSAVLVVGGVALEGIDNFTHVFVLAVALAVAVVPEGLPAVLTLTLSMGVERMTRRKAVVRKLAAVEALGAVTVIATDKTGTLTANRLQVRNVEVPDQQAAWVAMAVCNDADLGTEAGHPLDLALLRWLESHGHGPATLTQNRPRRRVLPFDATQRFSAVTVTEEGAPVTYFKGAPEVVLAASSLSATESEIWQERADAYAASGLRVIALARRADSGSLAEDGHGPGQTAAGLDQGGPVEWLGLVTLWDPPRPEVPEAIARAQEAGIRVLVVTGDHAETAGAIARAAGILPGRTITGAQVAAARDDDALARELEGVAVVARARPEHKLRLITALQRQGEIVAMTGDGVNDAPALRKADVGVAMGLRGSDVAREASELVLLDDNFATIVAAVEEGRGILRNVQKIIRFVFAVNMAELLMVAAGAVGAFLLDLREASGRLLLPLTAVQILWINLVSETPVALALALDQDRDTMCHPPRRGETSVLDRRSLKFIPLAGVSLGVIGLLTLIVAPGLLAADPAQTRTIAFLTLLVGQLLFPYLARGGDGNPRGNRAVHAAAWLGIALQLGILAVPSLRTLLDLAPLNWQMLALVGCGAAAAVLLAGSLTGAWTVRGAARRRSPPDNGSAAP